MRTFPAIVWLVFLVGATPLGEAADIKSELIFPPQSEHVHSSSIVECPNGDLLAAWFQGSGERSANDVRVMGSRLRSVGSSSGNQEWESPFLMADTPDIPDCNPVLFIDAQERLWMFWIVVHTNRWERSILKYRRADSYRKSAAPQWNWQDIILLDPGDTFPELLEAGLKETGFAQPMWAEYAPRYADMLIEAAKDPVKRQIGWMTRTCPITLPSGRILLPLYSDGYNASLMAYSDDGGDHWNTGRPIVGLGPIQPTIARRKNGELVAYCRDSGIEPSRVMHSVSSDDGETWSVARDTNLPNPGSSLAVVTLADSRFLMVYNDTEEGRHQLAVAISSDEGATWPVRRHLEQSEPRTGSYGYPTAVQARDGRVHVSYSHRGESGASIKHAAFDVEWVAE